MDIIGDTVAARARIAPADSLSSQVRVCDDDGSIVVMLSLQTMAAPTCTSSNNPINNTHSQHNNILCLQIKRIISRMCK